MKLRRASAVLAVIAILATAALVLLTGSMDKGIGITGFAVKGGDANTFSPQDRIAESQISADEEEVVVKIANATIGRIEGTNSMVAVLGKSSNAIMVRPQNADEIKEGDIIAYQSGEAAGLVVHRTVEIGNDEQGWFAITKGDNSRNNDPEKVRFGQVRYIVVGIVY